MMLFLFLRILLMSFLISLVAVIMSYLASPVFVIAILGTTVEAATFLIGLLIYTVSLFSQQKPKEARIEERSLLKALIIVLVLIFLLFFVFISGLSSFLSNLHIFRNNVAAGIPSASLGLSMLIALSIFLLILRKKYAGSENIRLIVIKIIRAFIVCLMIPAFLAIRAMSEQGGF